MFDTVPRPVSALTASIASSRCDALAGAMWQELDAEVPANEAGDCPARCARPNAQEFVERQVSLSLPAVIRVK